MINLIPDDIETRIERGERRYRSCVHASELPRPGCNEMPLSDIYALDIETCAICPLYENRDGIRQLLQRTGRYLSCLLTETG
jgi:hypothetical protein